MKVLLFGGSGMLGEAVRAELQTRGHEIQRPSHVACDISDAAAVGFQFAAGPWEVVVNCAGINPSAPGKPDIPDREIKMVFANACGSQVLAQACRQHGARLVHVSTDCVFSGQLFRSWLNGGPLRYEAQDDPDARDIYGRSKIVGETLGPILDERGAVVRTSFVGLRHGLLRWLLDQAESGHANGYRNALWTGSTVWEVARGLADIAEDPSSHGIVHLATTEVHSKYDVLLRLAEILRLNVAVLPVESPYVNRALRPTRTIRDLWDPAVAAELVERAKA